VDLDVGAQRFTWQPERGGRLVSWCVDGIELLGSNGDHPVAYGMYPMAPWAGRIADNTIRTEDAKRLGVSLDHDFFARINHDPWAIHGTCFTDPVDDMGITGNCMRARQQIRHWPWRAELISDWTILEHGFESRLTLISDEPSPVILGWHPWFRKVISEATAAWSMESAVMAVRRDSLPTGEWIAKSDTVGPYDDVFESPGCSASIHWPGVMSLDIESSHPWFVVYDEPAEVFCIEPQTNIPNAFRAPFAGEPDIADADSPVSLTNRWTWRRT
jgi:galactose mutarotase-like enzyme